MNPLKSILLILSFNVMFFSAIGQNLTLTDSMQMIYKSKDYAEYRILKEDSSMFLKNENLRDHYNRRMGVLNSFFGNYKEAIDVFDISYNSDEVKFEKFEFDKYIPISANKVLDSLSKVNQIIILNEAHHIPQNRIITLELLQVFYNNGYRYLAMETLNVEDKALNKRGYPQAKESGYYTDEPCSGDLVRTALKIGFTLIGYESEGDSQSREKGQAKNIVANVFSKDPKAKLIIHCGNMHGIDIEMGDSVGLMGYHLKKITGIDPLVINQATLTEDIKRKNERADYQYAMQKYEIKEPTIFINKEGKIWHYEIDGDIDLFIPRSHYKYERPTWLTLNGKKKYYFPKIAHLKIQAPFLIQVFFEKEGIKAVPIDQIEILDTKKTKALVLYKGHYIMKIINTKGETIVTEKIIIK
jgi:hypothetical protein